MEIEIRRFRRNKVFLMNFFMVLLCFLIGYILCKSIDKVENLSIGELLLSEVTVFSQLGFLIFPITIMMPFYVDYNQKNIFFYNLLGKSYLQYFRSKIIVIFISLSIPTVLATTACCILYNDFEFFKLSLFYMESILIWQVLILSIIIFVLKNIILSYIVNLFVWLITIFVSVANKKMSFLSYFDASNEAYKNLSDILLKKDITDFNYSGALVILSIILIGVSIIMLLSKERWRKNGL